MAFYDAVLHLDSGEESMAGLVLRNAANYLNGLPDEKFQLDIVANGGGVLHFSRPNPQMRQTVEELMARGVRVKLCANALREHSIPPENVWPGCQIVPAGLVEVVRLQRDGFAYIKP